MRWTATPKLQRDKAISSQWRKTFCLEPMAGSGRFLSFIVAFSVGCAAVDSASARGFTTSAPLSAAAELVNTDFLSDEQWRKLPREVRRATFARAFLSRLEPSGQAAPERLPVYIERYREAVVFDKRLAVFDVHAQLVNESRREIDLVGEVSLGNYRSGLEDALTALGFTVRSNHIAVLPDPALAPLTYAVSTTATASMRREPRDDAEQVHTIVLGWPLRLLRPARAQDVMTSSPPAPERRRRTHDSAPHASLLPAAQVNHWYLAQSAEGYVGFVRADQIRRSTDYRLPDGCLMTPATARDRAMGRMLTLPAMAALYRNHSNVWTTEGPSGPVETVLDEQWVSALSRPLQAESILQIAKPLLGTKYVWGGVNEQGIDCSGFSQFVYRARGVHLPRDAEEQSIVGLIVAFGRDVEHCAQPGDLIFFVNERGRVSHVAVSLGGGRIVHSSRRDVHVSSLDEKSEDSEQRLIDRVLYARRVLGW